MSRITLRPVIEEDLPVLYEHQRDPVATEMAVFPSRDWEPFLAHWHRIMADESVTQRTILVDEQVAGCLVYFVQSGEPEVGYWIGREFWGRGVATEALRQFLPEITVRPLYAHVAKTNAGSRRVLEKCGFRLLREDNQFSLDPGVEVEEYVMVLEH